MQDEGQRKWKSFDVTATPSRDATLTDIAVNIKEEKKSDGKTF
jgi:hypothetical protein